MISRRTSSISEEEVVFPRLLYSDSRPSQACRWHSQPCHQRSQACHRYSLACCRPSHACCQHSQACLERCNMFPNSSQSLPQYSYTSHQRSQFLRRTILRLCLTTTKSLFNYLTYKTNISIKHFCPGGMATSEWMHSIRAIRETPVADYSVAGVETTCCVAYWPPITILPFLLTLLVCYFKQTLWRCGQL